MQGPQGQQTGNPHETPIDPHANDDAEQLLDEPQHNEEIEVDVNQNYQQDLDVEAQEQGLEVPQQEVVAQQQQEPEQVQQHMDAGLAGSPASGAGSVSHIHYESPLNRDELAFDGMNVAAQSHHGLHLQFSGGVTYDGTPLPGAPPLPSFPPPTAHTGTTPMQQQWGSNDGGSSSSIAPAQQQVFQPHVPMSEVHRMFRSITSSHSYLSVRFRFRTILSITI